MSDKSSAKGQDKPSSASSFDNFVEISLQWGAYANGTAAVATLAAVAQLWSSPGAPIPSLCNALLALSAGCFLSVFGKKLKFLPHLKSDNKQSAAILTHGRAICAQLSLILIVFTALVEIPTLKDAWLNREYNEARAAREKKILADCERLATLRKEREKELKTDRRRMGLEFKTALRKLQATDAATEKTAYENALEDVTDVVKELESSDDTIQFPGTVEPLDPCSALR